MSSPKKNRDFLLNLEKMLSQNGVDFFRGDGEDTIGTSHIIDGGRRYSFGIDVQLIEGSNGKDSSYRLEILGLKPYFFPEDMSLNDIKRLGRLIRPILNRLKSPENYAANQSLFTHYYQLNPYSSQT